MFSWKEWKEEFFFFRIESQIKENNKNRKESKTELYQQLQKERGHFRVSEKIW